MEEKDLQQGELTEEVTQDLSAVSENGEVLAGDQIPVFNMSAQEAPQIPHVEEIPVSQIIQPQATPSARERLRSAVLEGKEKPPVSGFMRPGGLFEGYEITNARELPMFVRIFAASALAHLVIFAAALQLPAAVETTCESTQFTQQLCDTIYVASLLSNSNRGFTDEPVEDPTQIPDAINGEEVTMISANDFTYPEGYWSLRDEIEGRISPEQVIDPATGLPIENTFGGTTTGPGAGLDFGKPANLPGANPGAIQGDPNNITLGSGSGGSGGSAGPLAGGGRKIRTPRGSAKVNNNSPETLPPLGGGEETVGAADPTNPANPATTPGKNPNGSNNGSGKNPTVATPGTTPGKNPLPADKYNRDPLYKFREWLVEWRKNENNTFDKKFQYQIQGKIDKDGKLEVTGNPAFAGEPQMQELVKSGVGAFSDSGMLKLLQDLQTKEVKITFVQDGNQFNIRLETAQGSERAATKLFNGINVGLELGRVWVANGVNEEKDPKNKEKEQVTLDLLKMANLKREGNTIIIDTVVPNNFVESMYQTYKKDLEEKKINPQGIAVNSNTGKAESK